MRKSVTGSNTNQRFYCNLTTGIVEACMHDARFSTVHSWVEKRDLLSVELLRPVLCTGWLMWALALFGNKADGKQHQDKFCLTTCLGEQLSAQWSMTRFATGAFLTLAIPQCLSSSAFANRSVTPDDCLCARFSRLRFHTWSQNAECAMLVLSYGAPFEKYYIWQI